ncbi:hypothetical protein CBR_g41620 [Chara braunii]|uniref:Uncharacterized protein n=1 Tax=Chara braunii TaxID=69332 RepID=A0A388LW53_CHABU|nr:hypothetical protein CBR_g41620 [Chara braunii]|eukprot:GBG86557.1 hypothetical protein CBR_g41620 [Chara braunii]
MGELRYLQTSVALVLGFIGSKMIAEYLGEHIPTTVSLAVVMVTLGTGVLLSFKDQEQSKELEWDIFPEIINDDNQDEKDEMPK